ncbi:MAG TPA: DinB family protein [Dehalococcoidia bacterium]|nr:DinB family protein [Dehalococcoidia bacterium]
MSIRQNIEFWHDQFPALLVAGLTPDQLAWQPDKHDTSVQFAIWHAFRAGDDLLHGLVFKQPSVFASQGWADRLRAETTGMTPFGNGMTREQIGALRFDIDALLAYGRAVGESVCGHVEHMSDEDSAAAVSLPFFAQAYPTMAQMSKAECIAFFAIGHICEHLGEVQMVKGLMGMRGAPL